MNDNFLHRLRVQPPLEFTIRLAANLQVHTLATRSARRFPIRRAWPALVMLAGAAFAAASPAVRTILSHAWSTLSTAYSNSVPAEAPETVLALTPKSANEGASAAPAQAPAQPQNLPAGSDSNGLQPHVTGVPDMSCKPFLSTQKLLPPSQWNECVGTYTYGNDNFYRGQFRHGDRDGVGILEIKYIGRSSSDSPILIGWDEPAIYVGSFKDGRLNGYGLLIAKSGAAYAGTFKDNFAQPELLQKKCAGDSSTDWTNCIGAYRFPNGNVYRGEFVNGTPEGLGALEVNAIGYSDSTQVRLPVPGVYVGDFKDGKLSGHGAVVMPGAGYFGTFRDNTFDPAAKTESQPGASNPPQ